MTRRDTTAPLPRLAYTVAEVAESLGISEREVHRRAVAGEIPSFKIGRRRLIRRADLETYLDKAAAS